MGFLVDPCFIISAETPQGLTLCCSLCTTRHSLEIGQWTRNEEIRDVLVDLLQMDSVILGKPQPMPICVHLHKEDSKR